MPIGRTHKRLREMAFGSSGYPVVPVDKQMDEYAQKAPGPRHRSRDHDPLRTGDYEDPSPDLDKWRIVYRLFHIATDSWWTNLSKIEKKDWEQKIKRGIYPSAINGYFWQILVYIDKNPLDIYKVLPWSCEPLPESWTEYIQATGKSYKGNKVKRVRVRLTPMSFTDQEQITIIEPHS